MNISSQLRIILLLAGVVVFVAIYFFSRRRTADTQSPAAIWDAPNAHAVEQPVFPTESEPVLDEDEFEVPAYIRKQNQEGHFENSDRLTAEELQAIHHYQPQPLPDHLLHDDEPEVDDVQPVLTAVETEPFEMDELHIEVPVDEPVIDSIPDIEPVTLNPEVTVTPSVPQQDVTPPVVPMITEPVATYPNAVVEDVVQPTTVAPTLSEKVTPAVQQASVSPPPPKKSDKPVGLVSSRKIIALRLAFPERVVGVQLLELLKNERVEHGKFNIFHRLHDGGTVFSLASMVEPGTFDPELMSDQQFPGVTLFMLLPGPLDGLIAYDQMLSFAQRLAHATNGLLQDERGSRLTAQIMDRLRDEVLDFQHLMGGLARST